MSSQSSMADSMANDYKDIQKGINTARKTVKGAKNAAKNIAGGAKKTAKFLKNGGKKAKIIAWVASTIGSIFTPLIVCVIILCLLPATLSIIGQEILNWCGVVTEKIQTVFYDAGTTLTGAGSWIVNWLDGTNDDLDEINSQLKQLNAVNAIEDGIGSYYMVSNTVFNSVVKRFQVGYADTLVDAKALAEKIVVNDDNTAIIDGNNDDKIIWQKDEYVVGSTPGGIIETHIPTGLSYSSAPAADDGTRTTVPQVYQRGETYFLLPEPEDVSTGNVNYLDPAFYLVAYQSSNDIATMNDGDYNPDQNTDSLSTTKLLNLAAELADDGIFEAVAMHSVPVITTTYRPVFHAVQIPYTVIVTAPNGMTTKVTKYLDVDMYDYTAVDITVTMQREYSAKIKSDAIQNIRGKFPDLTDEQVDNVDGNIVMLHNMYKDFIKDVIASGECKQAPLSEEEIVLLLMECCKDETPERQAIVKQALESVGCFSYLMGSEPAVGTTSGTSDCSGLMRWIYKTLGYDGLCRVTGQYSSCDALMQTSLPRPGDFQVMGPKEDESGHVRMYIGAGHWVECCLSYGANVNTWSDATAGMSDVTYYTYKDLL